MLLIFFSCAWVAGIFLGSMLRLPPALGLIALAPAALLFYGRRYARYVLPACLGVAVFIGAAVYSYASLHDFDAGKVSYYNDSGVVRLTGMVTGDPDVRDVNTRLMVAADSVDTGTGRREVSGRVLALVPRYPAYRYGDVLELTGELATPPRLDDFDYRGYLAHQGIYTTVYYPAIEAVETGRGLAPLAWLYDLRGRLAERLAQVLPEPQASLAQGIVLGIRANIPADLNDDFSKSGTAHILAISGMNLGIMAGIMLGIGLWIFGRRRYLYVWLALVAVWFYTVITGMAPPVVRGAIMATIFLLAEALGRQRSAIVALTAAAAVMVGLSPYILWDASFQLSFLAMAGLVLIFPRLREAGRRAVTAWVGEAGAAATAANIAVDTLSATLAAIIAVWPVVAYYFGIFSLVGPLATFMALPALPGIILLGGLAGVVGLASLAAAQVVGWTAWPFLTYLILVVRGLGSPEALAVAVGPFHPALIWGYYLALGAGIWFINRRQGRRPLAGAAGLMKAGSSEGWRLAQAARALVVPLLVAALLLSYTAATLPGDDLRVSFLDVGEGDAVLIQQGSRQVLVDGGPSPGAITLGLGGRMPFWDRTIDVVVLTHPHQDHLAGLVEALRRYRVGRVFYLASDYSSPVYDEWLKLIDEKGIEARQAEAGQRIDLGEGVTIDVVFPGEPLTGTDSDIDNNGLVLRVGRGRVSFLLTADIMADAERELLRERASGEVTVLKVAHHGSATSTIAGFLAAADPEAVVISCGAGNRFGHPDEAVLGRLAAKVGTGNVYRTDEQGTIDFTTDGERLWVATER
jgi:competence protein ComEC